MLYTLQQHLCCTRCNNTYAVHAATKLMLHWRLRCNNTYVATARMLGVGIARWCQALLPLRWLHAREHIMSMHSRQHQCARTSRMHAHLRVHTHAHARRATPCVRGHTNGLAGLVSGVECSTLIAALFEPSRHNSTYVVITHMP